MKKHGNFFICSYCGQNAHHIIVWACPHHDEIRESYACDDCKTKYWAYQREILWNCAAYTDIHNTVICGEKLLYEMTTL